MYRKSLDLVGPIAMWVGVLFLVGFIIFTFKSCGRAVFDKGTYYAYDIEYDDSARFHKATCHYINLDDEDEKGWIIRYDSYSDARDDDYIPCPHCLPEAYEEYIRHTSVSDSDNEDYEEDDSEPINYIANRTSGEVHLSFCPLVQDIPEEDKVTYNAYINALHNHYVPCSNCRPDEFPLK